MMGPLVDRRVEAVAGKPDQTLIAPPEGTLLTPFTGSATVVMVGDIMAIRSGGFWFDTASPVDDFRAYMWRFGNATTPSNRFGVGNNAIELSQTDAHFIGLYASGIPPKTTVRTAGPHFDAAMIYHRALTTIQAVEIARRLAASI